MKDHLVRLGIRPEVDLFFADTYTIDKEGNLVFSYGDNQERFGISFHLIPISKSIWRAGQENPALIRKIFVCRSAMDAISFLHLHFSDFPKLDHLHFVAIGLVPQKNHFEFLRGLSKGNNFNLVTDSGIFGHIADLKLAAGIKGKTCYIRYGDRETIRVNYRNKIYEFPEMKISLNAFEILSGLRSGMRTYKPKSAESYTAQLLQDYRY